jgi:hypothetical protein
MTKKSKIAGDELVLTAKAIRRGEKLERTLTKLVTIQEPRSAAEAFLKAVQKGIQSLRTDDTSSTDKGKISAKKAKASVDRKSEEDKVAPAKLKRVRSQAKVSALKASESEAA